MANTTGKKWGGRKKGSQNKLTRDVKECILAAFDKVGGADYLVEQAEKNPTAFLTLIGKVLPMVVAGDQDSPLKTKVTVEFVKPEDT